MKTPTQLMNEAIENFTVNGDYRDEYRIEIVTLKLAFENELKFLEDYKRLYAVEISYQVYDRVDDLKKAIKLAKGIQ